MLFSCLISCFFLALFLALYSCSLFLFFFYSDFILLRSYFTFIFITLAFTKLIAILEYYIFLGTTMLFFISNTEKHWSGSDNTRINSFQSFRAYFLLEFYCCLFLLLPESIYFSLFGYSFYWHFVTTFTRIYEKRGVSGIVFKTLPLTITKFRTRKWHILIFRVSTPSLPVIILYPKLDNNLFSGKLSSSISQHHKLPHRVPINSTMQINS